MPDNIDIETIIKLIDGELDNSTRQTVEEKIATDEAWKESYQILMASKEAIKSKGLQEKVRALQTEYLATSNTKQTQSTQSLKSYSLIKRITTIAAVLCGVMIGYAVFFYATTNNTKVYNVAFINYELPIHRGTNITSNIDSLYEANDYTAVITSVAASTNNTQQDLFLAAQSYLQLNNAEAAINYFKQVEVLNAKTSTQYFEQETDYYLALAYIKANKIEPAKTLINKILASKQHMFYANAKAISETKLWVLQQKEK